ncbi:MAG: transcriptional regulator [Planctomycetaceae bacterium]
MSHGHPPRLPGCSVLPPMNPRPATANNSPKDKPKKRATGERFSTINAFVDCSLAELSRSEALTWFVLWRDTKGGTSRTSATDIARRIGASKRAVLTALSGLAKRGLLSVLHRGGINRGVSVYRLQPLAKPTAHG